jgi:hypothetical protein
MGQPPFHLYPEEGKPLAAIASPVPATSFDVKHSMSCNAESEIAFSSRRINSKEHKLTNFTKAQPHLR